MPDIVDVDEIVNAVVVVEDIVVGVDVDVTVVEFVVLVVVLVFIVVVLVVDFVAWSSFVGTEGVLVALLFILCSSGIVVTEASFTNGSSFGILSVKLDNKK